MFRLLNSETNDHTFYIFKNSASPVAVRWSKSSNILWCLKRKVAIKCWNIDFADEFKLLISSQIQIYIHIQIQFFLFSRIISSDSCLRTLFFLSESSVMHIMLMTVFWLSTAMATSLDIYMEQKYSRNTGRCKLAGCRGRIHCALLCQQELGDDCQIFGVSASQCAMCSACDTMTADALNLEPMASLPFPVMYQGGRMKLYILLSANSIFNYVTIRIMYGLLEQ